MFNSALLNKNNTELAPEPTLTCGEILADGTLLDRLRNDVLICNVNGEFVTGTELRVDGKIYRAAPLNLALQDTLAFVDQPLPYTSTSHLYSRLVSALQQQVGLDHKDAILCAAWILATHLNGAVPVPTLNLFGPREASIPLLQFLKAVVRRPLPLTSVREADILALPPGLAPTLLLAHAPASATQFVLTASTTPGFGILRDGCLKTYEGATAVYSPDPLTLPMLPIAVGGGSHCAAPLSKSAVANLREQYQPQLLQFRLNCFSAVSQSTTELPVLTPHLQMASTSLARVLLDDPASQAELLDEFRALDRQERAEQSQSPAAALVEVLYDLAHQETASKPFLQDVTTTLNLRLKYAGERLQLSPKGVGRLVRGDLHLDIRRVGGGCQVILNSEASRRIHLLARDLGLQLAEYPGSCPLCGEGSTDCQVDEDLTDFSFAPKEAAKLVAPLEIESHPWLELNPKVAENTASVNVKTEAEILEVEEEAQTDGSDDEDAEETQSAEPQSGEAAEEVETAVDAFFGPSED